ncbi:AAA family ATPase [Pelagibacterium nitratireducens]|uniref:AAA family ATPase n=1 Tax=Pelagibacterium nitratireducens TaxID=1046114 RepID=A0ABZ2I4B3_9HYPH
MAFSRISSADIQDNDAAEFLSDLVLHKALPVALRRKIKEGRPLTLIIEVPSVAWAEPIQNSVIASFETQSRMHVELATGTVKPSRQTASFLSRFDRAQVVVGVSQDPERYLPDLLKTVAEARVTVAKPDHSMVRKVIKTIARGRIPPGFDKVRLDVLDFDELAAVLTPGRRASEIVNLLGNVASQKTSMVTRQDLPDLRDAVEYGQAREWALTLRDDLDALRRGEITWAEVDRGCVLFGPPGTGKSLFAQALGPLCDVSTVATSMGEFFASTEGHLDSVIKAQRAAFDRARQLAPSILFLDEINALPDITHLEGRGKDWWSPVILDFYNLLDSAMADRDGVIVIGATNRIEDINPALLRPGRLERAIEIGPPTARGIERIFRHHLRDTLSDFDLREVAERGAASQATGANVMEWVRAARRTARRHKRDMVLEDLAEQIPRRPKLSSEQDWRVCVHEAGHAVAAVLLDISLTSVSVVGSAGEFGGATLNLSNSSIETAAEFEKKSRVLLAGRISEELLLGEACLGWGGREDSDISVATESIASLHASFGFGPTLAYRGGSNVWGSLMTIDSDFREGVNGHLNRLYTETRSLLSDHRDKLLAVARELKSQREV